MTTANVIRTFASKPFVRIDCHTDLIQGSAATEGEARNLGYPAGESAFIIVDLSDVAGFCEAAANAADIDGAIVAQYANGQSCREIADWLRETKNSSFLIDETVAARIRKVVGSLSRAKARRQVAEWILESEIG